MTGKLCFYYSLGTLLWQLCLLVAIYLCNISPMKSADIMTFLTLFTPLVMLGSYLLLRILSRMDDNRKRREEISEVNSYLMRSTLLKFKFFWNSSMNTRGPN